MGGGVDPCDTWVGRNLAGHISEGPQYDTWIEEEIYETSEWGRDSM